MGPSRPPGCWASLTKPITQPGPTNSKGIPAPLVIGLGPAQGPSQSFLRVIKYAVPNKWWHGNFLHHVSCQGGQQIPLTAQNFTVSLPETCWGEINQLRSPETAICFTAAAPDGWDNTSGSVLAASPGAETLSAMELSNTEVIFPCKWFLAPSCLSLSWGWLGAGQSTVWGLSAHKASTWVTAVVAWTQSVCSFLIEEEKAKLIESIRVLRDEQSAQASSDALYWAHGPSDPTQKFALGFLRTTHQNSLFISFFFPPLYSSLASVVFRGRTAGTKIPWFINSSWN